MMENIEDIDRLMDNFDMKTFWQKKKLKNIFLIYGAYMLVGTGFLIKAVIDASDAGAIPKGVDVSKDAKGMIVR